MLCDLTIRSWGREVETEMFSLITSLNLFLILTSECDFSLNLIHKSMAVLLSLGFPSAVGTELFAGSRPGPQFHQAGLYPHSVTSLVYPGLAICALFSV